MPSSSSETSSTNSRRRRGSILTRTKLFESLVHRAFLSCDTSGSGELNKVELYAGLLLVHVTLARYAGPAACFPPSRQAVDELFDTSDSNKTGHIDEADFLDIMVICCATIFSRMLVYYAILVLMVPVLYLHIMENLSEIDVWLGLNLTKIEVPYFLGWVERFVTWGKLAETVLGLMFFYLVVPLFWNWIEKRALAAAVKRKATTRVAADKKKSD